MDDQYSMEFEVFMTRYPRLGVLVLGVGVVASLMSLFIVAWLALGTVIALNRTHNESLQRALEEGGDE